MASNDTYAGALEVLAKQIAGMMGLTDANLPFCQQLLEMVTNEARSPEMAMQKAGVLPGNGAGGMAPPQQNPQGNQALGLPVGPGGPGGASAPPPSFLGADMPGGPPQGPPPGDPAALMQLLQGGG